MGAVIVVQTALLIYAAVGWYRAYRRAKRALKKLSTAQQELVNTQRIPPAGYMRTPVQNNRRSRSQRDEERINPGPAHMTYQAGPGINAANLAAPPNYANIVC